MRKTKEDPANVLARGHSYRKRMIKKGYCWLCHFVPMEFKEKIKEYAKQLRRNTDE